MFSLVTITHNNGQENAFIQLDFPSMFDCGKTNKSLFTKTDPFFSDSIAFLFSFTFL